MAFLPRNSRTGRLTVNEHKGMELSDMGTFSYQYFSNICMYIVDKNICGSHTFKYWRSCDLIRKK